MRCWSNSIVSCRTLPGARASSRQAANRSVRPSSVSRALTRTKPPSVLTSGRSKRATTGFAKPSPWKVTCVIQSVAIEPPRDGVLKRLDTAFIAPTRGSVALLFHLSRIFQARHSVEHIPPIRREPLIPDVYSAQVTSDRIDISLVAIVEVAGYCDHGGEASLAS